MSSPTQLEQIVSALVGLAVMAITTLGPRLIRLAQHWLTAHDPGAGQPEPPADDTPPAPAN